MEYKALSVRQPFADLLIQKKAGQDVPAKRIELRSRKTNYRGELVICASKSPEIPLHKSGCIVGIVELCDCRKVSELTEEERAACCVAPELLRKFENGWAWVFRNARRVIELPVQGKLGIFTIDVPEGLEEYPQLVEIGEDGWELIKKQIQEARL